VLFRAVLDGNKLVFGTENHEESQPWLVIGERVTASKSLWKRAYFGFWPWPADEFTVYKKGGRPDHALIQTENAISFSYLPILIGLGNLPSGGGLVHCDRKSPDGPSFRRSRLLPFIVHSGR
jgi:hypothetical protein